MTSILREDIPALEPTYGYQLLAETLLEIVREPRQGAFVLGLHGPWGTGKTTLLNALEAPLREDPSAIVVPFNAWKYQEREVLWRALIIHVLEALRSAGVGSAEEIDRLERALYAGFTIKESGALKVDWGAAATEAMLLAMRVGTANLVPGSAIDRIGDWLNGLFGRETGKANDDDVGKSMERVGKILTRAVTEKQVHQVTSIEQFLDDFRQLVGLAGERRLCVLVDDLDRCLPESALEIFEAIKLFLDAPQCTYVVALDRDVIRRGLAMRYREAGAGMVDPDEYIEKTISLSFDLPPLGIVHAEALLADCATGVSLTPAESKQIVELLGTNPRRLKRVGRSLAVLWALARAAPAPADPAPWPLRDSDRPLFLKLSLLAYRNSGVFAQLVRDSGLPGRLQKAADSFVQNAQEHGEADTLARLRKQVVVEHAVVRQAAEDPVFWWIMAMKPGFPAPARVAAALRWYGSASAAATD
ncbi:MAG TPA: P-loop NTPase fold protein [Allosphingosinicella sp.]|nr:P-loop NTPase fold protein [Allosphingosinicella sp.]